MLTQEDHLFNLVRHIGLVRDACLLLGRRLIKLGRGEFGILLIARGHAHDATKFYGIEWEFLHAGNDVPTDKLELAVEQHRKTNDHHPEYWGGFKNMPELCVAEMVCDWYARAQEFGSALRDWIQSEAIEKFGIDTDGERYAWVQHFVDLLLEDTFQREEEKPANGKTNGNGKKKRTTKSAKD